MKYSLDPIYARVEPGDIIYQLSVQKRRTRPPGKEAASEMDSEDRAPEGIKQLVQKYKQEFRIPENLNHYAVEDYRAAEKQFVRFCLKNGCVSETNLSRHSE